MSRLGRWMMLGFSVSYRIAVGAQQGRRVYTRQTRPVCDDPFDGGVGKVAGFSLHAGVAARLHCGSSLRVSTMGRCRAATESPESSCSVLNDQISGKTAISPARDPIPDLKYNGAAIGLAPS